jgi:exopolysaccharide biosynthesis polyprenyl glycosylphosphotransferase
MPAWVMPLVKAGVVIADAAIAACAFIGAFIIREGAPVLRTGGSGWSDEFAPYAGILYFAVVCRVVMLALEGSYRFHGAFSYTQEAITVFRATVLSSLLSVAFAFLFRGGYAFRDFSYSRGVFVLDFIVALSLMLLLHLGLRFGQSLFRRRGINLIPTLVVGTNPEALDTIGHLRSDPTLGFRVLGVISSSPSEPPSFEANAAIPIVGSLDDLPDLINELEIQEVVITDTTVSSERLFEVMTRLGRKRRVEFRIAPGLLDLLPQKTSVEQIGVLPMVRLFRDPLSDIERFIKRASDIAGGAAAAIVLAPFWLAAAILIKIDSRGPVFFRQERVGMDGRIFLCYKFRTMHAGADDRVHREAYSRNIAGDPAANAGDGEKPVYGKVKDDPRVTRVGRWLRRSSFDETPQLINVLKGDMSIVGPRPPIPYEVERYDPWHRKRLDMKPGITGLWQVSGRSRLTFGEMVKLDLFYIENWSLWLDLKIVLLTLPAVWRGDGAK